MMKFAAMMVLAGLAACDDKASDSGGTGTSGGSVSSCDWTDLNICFEWTDYAGAEQWCTDIGDANGFPVAFSAGACASGSIGECAIPAGGDHDVPATAYYYTGTTDPEQSCIDAGGTPL